jgi:hypothetical protein
MTGTKRIAIFGGAAALAVAVGFGGAGVGSLGDTSAATHPAASVAPANAPSNVHSATLVGCISDLNC